MLRMRQPLSLAHGAKAVSETGHARFADAEKAALNDPNAANDAERFDRGSGSDLRHLSRAPIAE